MTLEDLWNSVKHYEVGFVLIIYFVVSAVGGFFGGFLHAAFNWRKR